MNNSNQRFAWVNTILTIIVSSLLFGIIFSLNKYGKLSKVSFIVVNIIFLIISLALILSTIKLNNSKTKKKKLIYAIALSVFSLFLGFGFYLVNVIDTSIKEITVQSNKIEYSASFVVYHSNLETVDQLSNKRMGIIASDKFIEGNVLPKDELKKLEFDQVKFTEYKSYTSLINGLVKDEVDFISLPKDYKNLFSTNEEVELYLDDTKVIHNFFGKYDNFSKISGSDIDVTNVPFTVLLMGNDGGRTDTLMLATVNPKAMQLTLTSIARDSYVPIACYPDNSRDKINHSRNISRDCTIKTVEDLLDLSIDFYVEINFQGVIDLVNALGTIKIDSPASFHGNIESEEGGGVFIPEGVSDLDGNQVLAFVRERNSFADGDFQRQKNQQQVIDSLLTTVIETRDVTKLINLIKATGRNVETNMSLSQLIDLMNLGIVKMESTFLNNADIFTIYGSRITGRGALIYNQDFEKEIYYYILYNGSINDIKDLITMNLRSDGILEVPKGFNYNYNQGFIPPVFSQLEYYEAIDSDIDLNVPRPQPEEVEPEPEDDDFIEKEPEEIGGIKVEDFSNRAFAQLKAYADEQGLVIVVDSIVKKKTADPLYNKPDQQFVKDNQAGIFLNKGDNLYVIITEYEYDSNFVDDGLSNDQDPKPGDSTETKPPQGSTP
ncbi:MAG: hypothetical protein GX769_03700 [Erysipelothrix sp.]|nr:hypothetical protein [Erysipelothrix sp.]